MDSLDKYKAELERHLEVSFLCVELMDCLNEEVEIDSRVFCEKIKSLISFEKKEHILDRINDVFDSIFLKETGEEAYIEQVLLKMKKELISNSHVVSNGGKHEELEALSHVLLVYLDQLNVHVESMMCLENGYV